MNNIKDKIDALSQTLQDTENESREVIRVQLNTLAQEDKLSPDEQQTLHETLHSELDAMHGLNRQLIGTTQRCGAAVDEIETRLSETEKLEKRQARKFNIIPAAPTNAQIDVEEHQRKHFAQGMTFYKLFWVFFIGCFAGVVVEIIWCMITKGHYESRTGLIYGPFNLVYGFGAALLSACLYRFRNRSKIFSFGGGLITGSIVEYACSWVQEMLFGTTSWDYSNLPFNINGRICLLYSVFWGILGVMWIKDIYPRMSRWILKIPNKLGKGLTWALLAFMIFNTVMSGLTVLRWTNRREGVPAANAFERYLDIHYPNERMEKIYANMIFPEDSED